jgi:hypothetical protein
MFHHALPLPGYLLPEPGNPGGSRADPVPAIRSQAREIIDETLRNPDAGPEARELLRQRLVQAPFPERAEEVLLAHLRAMVSLNNPDFPDSPESWVPERG